MKLDSHNIMDYANIVPSIKRIEMLIGAGDSLPNILNKFGMHSCFYAVIFDTYFLKYYSKVDESKLYGYSICKCWLVCSRTLYPNGAILVMPIEDYKYKFINKIYKFAKVKDSIVFEDDHKLVFSHMFTERSEVESFSTQLNLKQKVIELSQINYNIVTLNIYTFDKVLLTSTSMFADEVRTNLVNNHNSIITELSMNMDTEYVIY